jgi:hypothetical protein
MRTLHSKQGGPEIRCGSVVQNLITRDLTWVKVVEIDPFHNRVKLSGLIPEPWCDWRSPDDIGAYYRDPVENSLAGGRCSSTGLAGHARQVIEAPPRADRRLTVSGPELDAIMAGLRLLAREVEAGRVKFADDDHIGYIWTDSGEHDGLPPEALDHLAARLSGE